MACIAPIHIENPRPLSQEERFIPVPCGKCPNCLKRRAAQWIFRLKQQDKVSSSAHFVTLTYGEESVPISPNGFMTLRKTDVQKFFKRLRKANGKRSIIKYYLAGEYGSTFKRPHYHIILFNARPEDVTASWQFGGVDIGNVSGASVGYVTGYVHKGKVVPEHKRDDREKEFSLMSKGLGLNYITQATKNYHWADPDRMYIVESGNTKVAMPRYYRDRLYIEEDVKRLGKKLRYKIEENEQKKMADFVRRTGSLKGYSLSLEEAKKAYFENYFKDQKHNQKRDF